MLGEVHGDHQCLSISWFRHLDACESLLWWSVSTHDELLETMCGGDFLSKHPDEVMDFLNYVAETSKGWDEPNPREVEKMRPSAHQRGGIFALSEDMEMKTKISTLARKAEKMEGKRLHEVQAVTENPAQANPCINCQPTVHPGEHYPIAP